MRFCDSRGLSVYFMHRYGYSYKEISAVEDISKSTVKYYLDNLRKYPALELDMFFSQADQPAERADIVRLSRELAAIVSAEKAEVIRELKLPPQPVKNTVTGVLDNAISKASAVTFEPPVKTEAPIAPVAAAAPQEVRPAAGKNTVKTAVIPILSGIAALFFGLAFSK